MRWLLLILLIFELAQIKKEVVDFLGRVLEFTVARYGLLLELADVASIVAVQGVGGALKSRLPFRYVKRALNYSAGIQYVGDVGGGFAFALCDHSS